MSLVRARQCGIEVPFARFARAFSNIILPLLAYGYAHIHMHPPLTMCRRPLRRFVAWGVLLLLLRVSIFGFDTPAPTASSSAAARSERAARTALAVPASSPTRPPLARRSRQRAHVRPAPTPMPWWAPAWDRDATVGGAATWPQLRVENAFPPRWDALDALRAATPPQASSPCTPLLGADGAFDASGAAALSASPGLSAAAFAAELEQPAAKPRVGANGAWSGGIVDINGPGVREWARLRAAPANELSGNAGNGTEDGKSDGGSEGGIERVIGNYSSGSGSRGIIMHEARRRPRMASRSRTAFCRSAVLLRDPVSVSFMPAGGCGAENAVKPTIARAAAGTDSAAAAAAAASGFPDDNPGLDVYLPDPAEWISVLSAECAVAEQTNTDWACVFQLMSPARLFQQMGDWHSWADIFRPRIAAGLRVQELDELAVIPPFSYPDAMGHFNNEALANYYLLDAVLPSRVPMLMALPPPFLNVIEQLRNLGVLRADRPAVIVGPREKSLVRARRTFFLRSPARDYNHTPMVTTTALRALNAALLRSARRRHGVPPGSVHARGISDDMLLRAVLLTRTPGGPRGVDAAALEAVVRRALPGLQTFDTLLPSSDLTPLAALVPRACLIIGPHGANLQNVVWATPGCWLIEIGFVAGQGGFKLPHCYHGIARAINLTYWVSFATSGDQASPLAPDADDLTEVLEAYRREMLVPRGLG